ncbi:MAG TPA: hypothetical protein VHT21_17640 [Stellaceae bacterium]|jgi:hypothetical protein|nr:hypothetical protein [Stellaceae bacterium]
MPFLPHLIASRQRARRVGPHDPTAPTKPPRGKPEEIDQRLDDLRRSYTLQQIVELPQKVIEGHGNNRRTARKIKDRARERLGALKP